MIVYISFIIVQNAQEFGSIYIGQVQFSICISVKKNTCNIYKISHTINDLRPRRIFFQPLYWTILLGHTDLLIRIRSRCTEEDYVGNCTRREWLATRVDNLQVQTFACFTLLRVSAPLKLTLSNCLSISIWNS